MSANSNEDVSRRDFLGKAAGTGLLILKPQTVRGSQANSAIRMGLLGCGGRGRAVATSFINNTSARYVALADLFPDQLDSARAYFNKLAASKNYGGSRRTCFSAARRRTGSWQRRIRSTPCISPRRDFFMSAISTR